MKNLILLLLLVLSLFYVEANAKYNFSYNILTVHNFDRSSAFENKIDNYGIFLTNKVFFIDNNKVGILLGEDSVGAKMIGLYGLKNLYKNKFRLDIDFIYGGYTHNKDKWNEKVINNKIGKAIGFIPVAGIKVDYNLTNKVKASIILTPLTINFLIGFGF